MFFLQPVPYILKDFLVDGDLATAANRGMEESGWLPEGDVYDFELRNRLGIVFKFPMVFKRDQMPSAMQQGIPSRDATHVTVETHRSGSIWATPPLS